MTKKNIVKIVLDVIMVCILALLYNSHVFALGFHEIAGLILAGFFVIHCLLNKKWISSVSVKLFDRSLSKRTRFVYVIDVLFLITFIIIIISGVKTSQILFPEFAAPKDSPLRAIHHFAGALSIILAGVHIGLHWSFVKGMWNKAVNIPKIIAKPLSIIFLVAILSFGTYSIFSSSFLSWLSEPFASSLLSNTSQHNNSQEEIRSSENEEKGETNNSSTNGARNGERKNGDGNNAHSGNEKKTGDSSPASVAHTILTYISIIGFFATITRFIDTKIFKKKEQHFSSTV